MTSVLFDIYYYHYDNFMRLFKLDNHQTIINLVKAKDPKQQLIADVGGGTGLLADTLIKLGHEVTIIDPAKKMTQIACQRNPAIQIINKEFQRTDFVQSFDIIILRDCFHHIKDQTLILGKIFQALKKDGLVIIQEFVPLSLSSKIIFAFERCLLEKVYPVTPAKLSEMMNQANFNSEFIFINSRDYLATGVKK